MLFLGIISLILGALILYKMVRHPFKYDDGAINFKGYASGIIFIFIGIYVLLTILRFFKINITYILTNLRVEPEKRDFHSIQKTLITTIYQPKEKTPIEFLFLLP